MKQIRFLNGAIVVLSLLLITVILLSMEQMKEYDEPKELVSPPGTTVPYVERDTSIKFYPYIQNDERGNRLTMNADSSITIKGDTMAILKRLVKYLLRESEKRVVIIQDNPADTFHIFPGDTVWAKQQQSEVKYSSL